MNVFAFELRQQARSIISGLVILLGLYAILMVGFFPIYSDAQSEVETVMAGMSPEFAAFFGIKSVGQLFSYGGFFQFSYLYLALTGAIMGAAWGLSVFAREKQNHCTDFLLTKPQSRTGIFVSKLAVCLLSIAIVNVLFLAEVALLYTATGDASLDLANLMLASSAVAGIQLLFCAVGAFLALFMRRVRSVSGIATAVGIAGFVLAALPSITGEESYRVIAPFLYFDINDALANGTFEAEWIALALAITVVLFVAGYLRYRMQDMPAQ